MVQKSRAGKIAHLGALSYVWPRFKSYSYHIERSFGALVSFPLPPLSLCPSVWKRQLGARKPPSDDNNKHCCLVYPPSHGFQSGEAGEGPRPRRETVSLNSAPWNSLSDTHPADSLVTPSQLYVPPITYST